MWAAKHLDLVSGFAVAVGVSAAMLTGYGVASADTGSAGATANTQSAAHSGPAKASPGAPKAAGPRHSASSTASPKQAAKARVIPTATPAAAPADSGNSNPLPAVAARFAALRTTKAASPPASLSLPAPSSLTTTPSGLVVPAAAAQVSAATGTATPTPAGFLTGLINDLFSPLAGNSPRTPASSPTDWIQAAVARRELASAAVVVDPTFTFDNGVIYGNVGGTGTSPLTYTVIGAPNAGGKVTLNGSLGSFSFLPDLSVVQAGATGTESFKVLVHGTTALVTTLEGLPIIGGLVIQPIVMQLYQTPVLSQLLAPLIGASTITNVVVPVGTLVDGNPVAFTTMVPSVHGALISVNWFPATGLTADGTAPTVLNGPGLGTAGNIDPTSTSIVGGLVPGLVPLRDDGYNVITWDPRGEFASTGILQLDSPAFEGQDVSSIIDFADTLSATQKAGTDPLIGMVGGSYGGGIQLVAAGIDSRIDAIVPGIAWNNLSDSLYPSDTFKTSYASLLLLSLVTTGARINTQIYVATVLGDLLGVLTQSQQALLDSSGPDFLDGNITAPTLFIQGTVDVLFPLEQALANAAMLPPTTPSSTIWFCGGHGACLTLDAAQQQAQTDMLVQQQLNWLDEYVKGEDIPDPPKFQWVDQTGAWHAADVLPSDPSFNDGALLTSGSGGTLPIVPLIGGSGPQNAIPIPYSLGLGAPARNAVNLKLDVGTDEAEIAGAPTLTMTYSGIGTSRSVYAQIVDADTGQVVGNIVTPIPVTLNGQQHTVTIPMENIAYTVNPDGTQSHLTLQLVTSATPFLNFTQLGVINISHVDLSLPVYNTDNDVPLPV
jgi:ABC-2 type transport system ATP-binding protein